MIALVHCYANGDLDIRTPYDAAFVAALKDGVSYSFREWDGARKVWSIEAPYAEVALGIVRRFFVNVKITDDRQADAGNASAGNSGKANDPFKELHLLPSAPAPLIHAAYKTLARLHHPDAGGDVGAMQRINAAYDRLKERAS
jgi:hypothetical protein